MGQLILCRANLRGIVSVYSVVIPTLRPLYLCVKFNTRWLCQTLRTWRTLRENLCALCVEIRANLRGIVSVYSVVILSLLCALCALCG